VLTQIVSALHTMQVQSLMVEGGAATLQSFIDAGLWDEARVISNTSLVIGAGVAAPVLKNNIPVAEQKIQNDIIEFSKHKP